MDSPSTAIYTLSLHDALPIFGRLSALVHLDHVAQALERVEREPDGEQQLERGDRVRHAHRDRKSTRLNSSHLGISYAVFCLKKKKIIYTNTEKNTIIMQTCEK